MFSNWQETLDMTWQPVIDQLYNQEITVEEALDQLQTGLEEKMAESE